jgi:hypothetical protein
LLEKLTTYWGRETPENNIHAILQQHLTHEIKRAKKRKTQEEKSDQQREEPPAIHALTGRAETSYTALAIGLRTGHPRSQ